MSFLLACKATNLGSHADLSVDLCDEAKNASWLLEFDAKNPQALILSHGHGPIYISDNLGTTWQILGSNPVLDCQTTVISIAPNSSIQGLLCMMLSNQQTLCTQNAARSWQVVEPPELPVVAASNLLISNTWPQKIYTKILTEPMDSTLPSLVEAVGWSDNLGATWQFNRELDATSIDLQMTDAGLFVVQYEHAGAFVVACHEDLQCSTAYDLRHIDTAYALLNPFEPRQMLIIPHAGDLITTIATDGTLQKTAGVFLGEQFGYMDAIGLWGTIVAIQHDSSLWHSQDGGLQWQSTGAALPEPSCSLLGNGQNAMFCMGQEALYRSMNAGATWQNIALPKITIRMPSVLF